MNLLLVWTASITNLSLSSLISILVTITAAGIFSCLGFLIYNTAIRMKPKAALIWSVMFFIMIIGSAIIMPGLFVAASIL